MADGNIAIAYHEATPRSTGFVVSRSIDVGTEKPKGKGVADQKGIGERIDGLVRALRDQRIDLVLIALTQHPSATEPVRTILWAMARLTKVDASQALRKMAVLARQAVPSRMTRKRIDLVRELFAVADRELEALGSRPTQLAYNKTVYHICQALVMLASFGPPLGPKRPADLMAVNMLLSAAKPRKGQTTVDAETLVIALLCAWGNDEAKATGILREVRRKPRLRRKPR